jgi:DNA excision repair protein ERCC-5
VVQAYIDPVVDKSTDPFEWAEPDDKALVEFCERKMEWTGDYTMSLLRPAIEAYKTRFSQTRIDQFANFYSRAARVKSVR